MRALFCITLLSGMIAASAVPAQDQPRPGQPPSQELRQMELHRRQLELNAQESEVNFQHQMRQMELEKRRAELDREKRNFTRPAPWHHPPCRHGLRTLFAFCLVIHLLLTFWVFQDIRKRNAGSGIWVVLTLLTGFAGALLYILTRIGDKPSAGGTV